MKKVNKQCLLDPPPPNETKFAGVYKLQGRLLIAVQLPGRFYKPRVLQGFLILFMEEKLKIRMDFACVSRESRRSPARFLLRATGIFHETLAGHHAWHGN